LATQKQFGCQQFYFLLVFVQRHLMRRVSLLSSESPWTRCEIERFFNGKYREK